MERPVAQLPPRAVDATMIDFRRLGLDLIALGLLAATLFVGLSLISYDPADPPARLVFPMRSTASNTCGTAGAHLAFGLHSLFGICAYLVLLSMAVFDVRLFSRRQPIAPCVQIAGWLLTAVSLAVAVQTLAPGLAQGQIVGSGGYVGAWGGALLERHFAPSGILILVLAAFLAGVVVTTELTFFRIVLACTLAPVRLFNRIALGHRPASVTGLCPEDLDRRGAFSRRGSYEKNGDTEETRPKRLKTPCSADDVAKAAAGVPRKPIKVNPPVTAKSSRQEVIESLEAVALGAGSKEFQLPNTDLLEVAEDFPYDLLAKKARISAVTLEKTFEEFGLNVHVVEIDTGPVITQFELELEAGLRLSKVTALADDLAIALRVPAVRVVAPIPGKNTVGVEVPNDKQVMVRLRELIESCPSDIAKKRIPVFLGKDVSGRPLVVDLTRLPHLLIAGRTGTGKSVCLNSLILSILMTRSPDQVKMLMIDPKMVELSPYKRIPHLMHPVITDMKKAEAVLAWAVDKMEERYDLLARCGVRHLDGYNKLGKEEVLKRCDIDPDSEEAESIPGQMPYIVILADEMADMMMTSGKDVEGHIIRLAQKSRAVGLHLVLATQKPTVDVITGLIKSNLPARISFQVASRTDSRVVLDEMGADRLLGNGDMLYLTPGTSKIVRAQGTFVGDDEVNDVISFFSDQEPQYSVELAQLSTSGGTGGAGPGAERSRDDLYERAIEIVVREGRGSVSLLQRCLGIGYGRAARLVDYMAEDGIVGDYNGSQAREVLYSVEQWEAIQAGEELELAMA